MASPFSIFRKNQRMLIAVLGILTMFAFVFLPILAESLGIRSAGPVNKTVVTSKFGDLRESDVNNLMQEHRKVLGVLIDIQQMAGAYPMLARQQAEMAFGGGGEEEAVNRWLLAQHAQKLGMVVTDEAVNAFLKRWTRDVVKAADIAAAFKRSGLSEMQFFSLMQNELAARQIQTMFYASLGGITPAERWEYYKRVKQMAKIEAAPVNVANYLDRIEDPKEEDLKAFFEKHKADYALPDSPEPGFREPQKVAMQWFKADEEKFAATVTDEEIKQRYEKNKDQYDQFEKKLEPPVSPTAEKPAAKDSQDAKESKPAATDKAAGEKAAAAGSAPAAKPADNPPAAKEPAAKEPVAPKAPADSKKEDKKTSAVERRSPFKLVSFLEGEKPAEGADKAAADKAAADKAAADKAAADKAAADKAAADKAAADKAAADKAAADKAAASATQGKPAETKPAETKPAETKPAETKAGLTDALKNRIRREIANEKVMKVFGGLRDRMQQYGMEWSKYQLAVRQQEKQPEGSRKLPAVPTKLDFEKLAKENGLSVGQTDLMTQWEARSSEIGGSLVDGRSPVWGSAFQSMATYRPQISIDMKGDYYLLWKTDGTKDRIPKFEDEGMRAIVLREWKMIEARGVALKEAEALAEKVTKSKKTLKEAFAGQPDMPVVIPGAFSWMTFGNVPLGTAPEGARISEVAGVEYAGNDFMRTVFRLSPDQIGAAMNGPKTIAYVVRLIELTPSVEVLQKEFEIDDFSKYAPVAMADQREIIRAWLEEIKTSAGLKWERNPAESEAGQRSEE